MNLNGVFNILGSIVVVAGITAAVLPNRDTAEVIKALGEAFSGAVSAAVGQ